MDNKQLLDEVLVMTGIIKFKLSVISRAEGVSTILRGIRKMLLTDL